MYYNLDNKLKTFDGKPLNFQSGGDELKGTLRDFLVFSCVNANPQEHSSGEAKYRIAVLAERIHRSPDLMELSVEEVAFLKTLAGRVLSVTGVGAVYKALENPVPAPPQDGATPAA